VIGEQFLKIRRGNLRDRFREDHDESLGAVLRESWSGLAAARTRAGGGAFVISLHNKLHNARICQSENFAVNTFMIVTYID
jgi:hypothetical protein